MTDKLLNELRQADGAIWADHYVEPHGGELYRRDARGNWYDLAGVRLSVPVFVRGDVLVSLPGKVSRKSFAFRGQELRVSPRHRLIQCGHLVYDLDLEPLRYFGDRVAGLGPGYVEYPGGEAWQEILLGLDRRAFVRESDARPLILNDEEIVEHRGTREFGGRRYDRWRSATREYLTGQGTDDVVEVDGRPVDVDFGTYLRFAGMELVQMLGAGFDGYFDLSNRKQFYVPALGDEQLLRIDAQTIPGREFYRIEMASGTYVYDAEKKDIFTVDDGKKLVQRVRTHPDFPGYFYLCEVAGAEVIVNQRTHRTLSFAEDGGMQIADLKGYPGDRLLNATSTRGETVVLDAGAGLDQLRVAHAGSHRILEVTGPPRRTGGLTLQPVSIRGMGGPAPRVVVISDTDLRLFTLPADLTAYPDQPEPSVFAGCEVISVDFRLSLEVEERKYYEATFLSMQDAEESVVLDAASGRPLHLEGAGHRNELVTGFDPATLRVHHHLGEHRMVGTRTLTWDHRRGDLMFSVRTGRSWLPFYDSYLPIFRRVVAPTAQEQDWDYNLFELRENAGAGEYVAVEKVPPYRVLATERGGKLEPRIITKKDRAPLNPEQIPQWRRLFLVSTTLVEVI